MTDASIRRALAVLLAAAALHFTANTHHLSLLPLDDAHYAQKGVEMFERGAFFSVTWAQEPNTQHPPFQFWLMSRSFAVFGKNDFAARFPSVVMALGVLLLTFDIGRRTCSARAGLAAVALLLVTLTFVTNARRAMLEIPTCFWVTATFWCYLRGLDSARWHGWMAIPIAAGILTKSVVGLVPLGILACAQLSPALRPRHGIRWPLLGAGLGLSLGASWTLHQGMTLGWDSMRSHYFGEVGRAAQESRFIDYFLAYPRIMVERFQPIVLPGLFAAFWVLRKRSREERPRAVLLSLWVVAWVAAASLSSARISRYVWPTLVPLALLAGFLLAQYLPRFTTVLVRGVVPAVHVALALVFWVSPMTLTRDVDAPFKQLGPELRERLAPYTHIPVLGTPAWRLSSPLLYYGRAVTNPVSENATDVIALAHQADPPWVLVERSRRSQFDAMAPGARTVGELRYWDLVELVSLPATATP